MTQGLVPTSHLCTRNCNTVKSRCKHDRKKGGDGEKYLPRKDSRHTCGRPCGGVLDSSSRRRLPLAMGRARQRQRRRLALPSLLPLLMPCSFPLALLPRTDRQRRQWRRSGESGLNRRASSLRSSSRAKRHLQARARTRGPLCGNRRDASSYGCVPNNFN